ncbi:MAG: hypothetical protein A2014_06800 [Spirochaetes bacterium GWF1_49_6]|nr:MAG: hypothetical protein A2014_06800 [Spirochaetes bacterium GWF1_49_6]
MRRVRNIATFFLFILIIITSGARPLWGRLPNLHLLDNYFCKENETLLFLEYQNIGLEKTSLHAMIFSVEYGINQNLQLGFNVPYLIMSGAYDSGALGNLSAFIKFSIAKSDVLTWLLSGELYFRFATGISSDEGIRWVNGVPHNYYPFVSRTTLFSPSVIGSLLIGDVMLNTSIGYKSEGTADEGLFDFAIEYDRIDFQISADYFFKFVINPDDDLFLFFRPVVYLEYKLNLSEKIMIPDGFYTTVELNFKLKKIMRWKFLLSVPVYSKTPIDSYLFSVQIGKSF